jgi:predicted ATPase
MIVDNGDLPDLHAFDRGPRMDLRVLATSRTPFGLPSEIVRRIPSLSNEASPDQEHSPTMAMLLDRVEAVRGGQPLGPQELADLRRITSRLAGNPRAIEQAALTLGEMSTGQLLEQRDRHVGLHDRHAVTSPIGRWSLLWMWHPGFGCRRGWAGVPCVFGVGMVSW